MAFWCKAESWDEGAWDTGDAMWQSEMPWYGCPMKGKPYRYSMDFKGKGKGKFAKDLAPKGKKKSSETDWVQSTNRIKMKDQLSELLLRTAADSSGSCFALFEKKKPSDKTAVSKEAFKQMMTVDSCHLPRRSGVSFSGAAGSLQSGMAVL